MQRRYIIEYRKNAATEIWILSPLKKFKFFLFFENTKKQKETETTLSHNYTQQVDELINHKDVS